MSAGRTRAWRIVPGRSGIEALEQVTLPQPEPGPGEVLVRIRACSLNYRDRLICEGLYPVDRPFVPLSDGAGEVAAVGAGVTRVGIGDRVAGAFLPDWIDGPPGRSRAKALGQPGAPGMLADHVLLAEEGVVHLAESLDYHRAATLPCAGVTAWNALMEGARPVRPGDRVLVLGTGGVALIALQIAKAAGARVIVTSSSDDKLARARALGADHGINYRREPEWGAAVAALGGADHVVETGGIGTLDQSMAALAIGGQIGLIGVMAKGGAPDLKRLMGKSATLRSISVGSRGMAERLNRAVDAGGIAPPIDRIFPFAEAREAYAYQHSPDLFGKIVIAMD